MKYILIFLFTISAHANDCYLAYDSTGLQLLDCVTGRTPYNRICKSIEGERVASDYKVEILEPGVIFDSFRDWSQGDTLAPGESIVCSIDSSAKVARLGAEKGKRDAADAVKNTKRSNWVAACAAKEIHELICQERGY